MFCLLLKTVLFLTSNEGIGLLFSSLLEMTLVFSKLWSLSLEESIGLHRERLIFEDVSLSGSVIYCLECSGSELT